MDGRARDTREDLSGRTRALRLGVGAPLLAAGALAATVSLAAQRLAPVAAQSPPHASGSLLLSRAALRWDGINGMDPAQTGSPGPVAAPTQAVRPGLSATPPRTAAAPAPAASTDATAGNGTSVQTKAADDAGSATLPPCPHRGVDGTIRFLHGKDYGLCQEQNPLRFIVEAGPVRPLTPRQKGFLALRGVIDPFNLITIAGFSAITIASDSHTAYGPGFRGFGRLSGYSLVGDVQGEFLGTFAIPVLTHEDPRYHRMAGARLSRRILHAIVHTYVTQHDNGSLMPNYSTLLGYPISSEISNLYVPGLQTNLPSTAKRVGLGIASDPIGALIAEFLPDVARRIHIHVIFMQQILNQVATGSATPP